MAKQEIGYNELPLKVKESFQQVIANRDYGEGKPDTLINLDSYRARLTIRNIDNAKAETISRGGAFYFFRIKNKTFKLRANQPDPFIIFERCLYFPNKFSAYSNQYLTVRYTKIDFSGELR